MLVTWRVEPNPKMKLIDLAGNSADFAQLTLHGSYRHPRV